MLCDSNGSPEASNPLSAGQSGRECSLGPFPDLLNQKQNFRESPRALRGDWWVRSGVSGPCSNVMSSGQAPSVCGPEDTAPGPRNLL